jgi:hypothetical protein
MAGFLQASGAIAMSEINSVFDSRGLNLNAYRGTTWFTAAGGSGTFSSGAISFSDFYSKGPSAARTFSLASLLELFGEANTGGTAYCEYAFGSDGSIVGGSSQGGSFAVGDWTTPITVGIGSSYWIRVTQTASSGGFVTVTGDTRGVWLQLSSSRTFGLQTTANGLFYRVYTFEIASDSGGSNIVATATGIQMNVEIIF